MAYVQYFKLKSWGLALMDHKESSGDLFGWKWKCLLPCWNQFQLAVPMDLSSSDEVVSNTTKVLVSFRDVGWRCLSVLVVLGRSNSITLFFKEEWCDFCRVFMDWKLGKLRGKHPLFIEKVMEWFVWSFRVEILEMVGTWKMTKR